MCLQAQLAECQQKLQELEEAKAKQRSAENECALLRARLQSRDQMQALEARSIPLLSTSPLVRAPQRSQINIEPTRVVQHSSYQNSFKSRSRLVRGTS